MKNIVCNPYLPSWEYVPDGEPHVFGDRLYLFGSHDRFGGRKFCENDYVVWSAPVDDLSDWTCHGIVYRREQDPGNIPGKSEMWAPDVTVGPDGRYYLYYGMNFRNRISVAVAEKPEGPYEFYGEVRYPDGTRYGGKPGELLRFDPGVFSEDGRTYLYTGFCATARMFKFIAKRENATIEGTGSQVVELEPDMLTVKGEPRFLIPGKLNSAGTGFEGHEFYEASSMRKFDGRYYAIYSSFLSHELAWAVSDRPDGGFTYGGTLHSNAGIIREGDAPTCFWGNNHGSVERVGGSFYVFGHRQTNCNEVSRQGVAEPIRFEDGRFLPAEMTSQGLYGKPLPTGVRYEAGIACALMGRRGACKTTKQSRLFDPFITQTGRDREYDPCQYIANIGNGTLIGYRYFDLSEARGIGLELASRASGTLEVAYTRDGAAVAEIPVKRGQKAALAKLPSGSSSSELWLSFKGRGRMDLYAFTLLPR